MKKLLLTALLLGSASFTASATVFQFDPEQDGAFSDVSVINGQLAPNLPVDVRQYFGVNGQLDNGDAFEEEFSYNFNNATLNPGFEPWNVDEVNFAFDLEGTISDVTYGAGVPDLADLPGNQQTFEDNMAATSFAVNFTNTESALTVTYFDGLVTNTLGVFDLVSTISTPTVFLDGSNTNSAFILRLQFNEAWAAANMATIDSVWRRENGDLIDIENFDLIAAGSAGPNGTSDGVFVDGNGPYVDINVKDNGATFTARIPEPSSIAMLGLALLGLARIRRKA